MGMVKYFPHLRASEVGGVIVNFVHPPPLGLARVLYLGGGCDRQVVEPPGGGFQSVPKPGSFRVLVGT
jgi:hypothetical protein